MTRRPLKSTLFPYTTLFRSDDDAFAELFANLSAHGIDGSNTLFVITTDEGDHFAGTPGTSDRKSTRLNSSHMSISYAVFCLKKKIKYIIIKSKMNIRDLLLY